MESADAISCLTQCANASETFWFVSLQRKTNYNRMENMQAHEIPGKSILQNIWSERCQRSCRIGWCRKWQFLNTQISRQGNQRVFFGNYFLLKQWWISKTFKAINPMLQNSDKKVSYSLVWGGSKSLTSAVDYKEKKNNNKIFCIKKG